MYQRRVVGIVLSIAAVGLIVGAIATRTWWIGIEHTGSMRVGLRAAEQCTRVVARRSWSDETPRAVVRCEDGTLRAWLRGDLDPPAVDVWDQNFIPEADSRPRRVPSTFVFLGTLVFIAGIGAMIAIVATAATAGRGDPRARNLPAIAAITCGGFAALAIAYVISAPELLRMLRAGPGLVLALAGAAAGVAGTLVLGRAGGAGEPTSAALAEADRLSPVSRAPGLIAGAVGVALVLGSLYTHGWFRGRDQSTQLGVGVQEAKVCRSGLEVGGSECEVRTIPADYGRAKQPTRMRIFLGAGTLALWTGLGATIAFVLVGGLALLRQAVGGPAGMARALAAGGASFGAAALVYVVSKPAEASEVSVSYGAFVALGGAATLIGGAVMIGRWVASVELSAPPAVMPEGSAPVVLPPPLAPPAEPSPFARPAAPPEFVAAIAAAPAAAPAPVIPPCPRCGTPMLWVTARSGYLCTICRERE